MSTRRLIGVGIIGASPRRGWGAQAHVPAIAASPDFRLAAVSTSRADTAEAAKREWGVPLAFDDHRALVERPEVDVVVVAVKVPDHLDLVTAAIEAGKAVYCEWPLGRDLAEAEQMTRLAEQRGIPAYVGLQARSAPALRHARHLIRSGYAGEVLSTSIVASAGQWGAEIDQANAYTNDRSTGATMLSIPVGHCLDALCWMLGDFQRVVATTAIRRNHVRISETGATIERTAADQVAVSGVLAGGAVAAVHFRGGSSRGINFLWEINGTEGDLRVNAGYGHVQIAALSLEGARGTDAMRPLDTPPEHIAAPDVEPGRPYNVAQVYAQLALALRGSATELPTFGDAVRHHRLIERIEASAQGC